MMKRLSNPILFILSAAFLFGLGSVLSKKVGNTSANDSIHPFQIVYARFFFAFIIVSALVFFKKTMNCLFPLLNVYKYAFSIAICGPHP